jgi:hypothetical protein
LGIQVWVGERQLATQKAEIARQEAALARQKAEWDAWQARAKEYPGQPLLPPPTFTPMPAVYQPPLFFPWFLWLFPILMAPAAYAIAAEQQRLQKLQQWLQQCEEEDQTPYSAEEMMENWEFKIVRCCLPLFDNPAFLERILREEACAGWQLVEKFDGTRVRLKRIAGRQPAKDLPSGYDPYRTSVGPTGQVKVHAVLWVFCILCLVLIPLFIVMQLNDPISGLAFWSLIATTSVGAIVLGFFALRQTAKFRTLANPANPGTASEPIHREAL